MKCISIKGATNKAQAEWCFKKAISLIDTYTRDEQDRQKGRYHGIIYSRETVDLLTGETRMWVANGYITKGGSVIVHFEDQSINEWSFDD